MVLVPRGGIELRSGAAILLSFRATDSGDTNKHTNNFRCWKNSSRSRENADSLVQRTVLGRGDRIR